MVILLSQLRRHLIQFVGYYVQCLIGFFLSYLSASPVVQSFQFRVNSISKYLNLFLVEVLSEAVVPGNEQLETRQVVSKLYLHVLVSLSQSQSAHHTQMLSSSSISKDPQLVQPQPRVVNRLLSFQLRSLAAALLAQSQESLGISKTEVF